MKMTFEHAIEIANSYYQSHDFSKSVTTNFKSSLKLIKVNPDYKSNILIVSPEWIEEQRIRLKYPRFKALKHAIFVLRFIYENEVFPKGRFKYSYLTNYQQLNSSYKASLSDFLKNLASKKTYDAHYINSRKIKDSYFLLMLQQQGIINPSQISFESLRDLHPYISKYKYHESNKRKYKSCFSLYIQYIENIYDKPNTLHLVLNGNNIRFLFFVKDLPLPEQIKFLNFKDYSLMDYSNFIILKNSFINQLEVLKYSTTELATARKLLLEFRIFMDANNFNFSLNLMVHWINYICLSCSTIQNYAFKRNLFLFKQVCENNVIDNSKLNITYKSIYKVPHWTELTLDEYLKELKSNDKHPSTIRGYKSAISKFLCYLNNCNISSFCDIKPQMIIDYQINDYHKTSASKNTNGYILRTFFQFLARKKLTSEKLELAIYKECANEVKIVTILSKKQKKSIYDFVDHCKTPMDYRIAAMVMIFLNLGFRSVDVRNLKFENIDWNKETISIIQQKTGEPLTLPFPIVVGNTLYRYITKGRPPQANNNPYVFVKHKVPYGNLNNNSITSQLDNILLKYGCKKTGGSHILRREYATDLLRSSTDFHLITFALGQVSDNSINVYLALDEDRLRMCGLNLKGIKIGGMKHDK